MDGFVLGLVITLIIVCVISFIMLICTSRWRKRDRSTKNTNKLMGNRIEEIPISNHAKYMVDEEIEEESSNEIEFKC